MPRQLFPLVIVGLLLVGALWYFRRAANSGGNTGDLATAADERTSMRRNIGLRSGEGQSSASSESSPVPLPSPSGRALDQGAMPAKATGAGNLAESSAPASAPVRITPELVDELRSHTWIGGGFHPPDYPDFDALFRAQRKSTAFTYTGFPLADGVYYGDFGPDANVKQTLFTISLRQVVENGHSGMRADWLQWDAGGKRDDLSAFHSEYESDEIYYGFLQLPAQLLRDQGVTLAASCPELIVIRHFDTNWNITKRFVEFFNSRVYCRRALDDLTFIGRMGFRLAAIPGG